MMYARDPVTGTNALRATTRRGGEPFACAPRTRRDCSRRRCLIPAAVRSSKPPEVLDSGGGAFFEAAEGRLFRRRPVIKEEVDQP